MARARLALCAYDDDMSELLLLSAPLQNVLLQLGLRLVGVDGLVIARTKRWVLRCGACFHLGTQLREALPRLEPEEIRTS